MKTKTQKEINKRKIKYETKCFLANVTPWGSIDINAAISQFVDYNKSGDDLAEEIREYQDATGINKLKDIDPCYVAWDSILQEARNVIDENIGFDICNDIKGDTEFHTYGNFCCTSYDYSEEAKEQLIEAIATADPDDRNNLLEEELVVKWLEEVEIDMEDINDKIIELLEDIYDEENINKARDEIHEKYKDSIDNSKTKDLDEFIDLIIDEHKKEFIEILDDLEIN